MSKNQVRILLLGLDSAGKTSILYKLKLDELVTTIPTLGFNVECIEYKNVKFTIWDVGGQERIRSLWMYYCHGAQGLVFVVDCNDRERIEEARFEMQHILKQEGLQNTVLLVFANKQVTIYSLNDIVDEFAYLQGIILIYFTGSSTDNNNSGIDCFAATTVTAESPLAYSRQLRFLW